MTFVIDELDAVSRTPRANVQRSDSDQFFVDRHESLQQERQRSASTILRNANGWRVWVAHLCRNSQNNSCPSHCGSGSRSTRAVSTESYSHWLLDQTEIANLRLVNKSTCLIVDRVLLAKETALLTSELCLLHRIPLRSERPERLKVILKRSLARFPRIRQIWTAPPVTTNQLVRFHSAVYVDSVLRHSKKIEKSMMEVDRVKARLDGSTPTATRQDEEQERRKQEQKLESLLRYEYIEIDDDTVIMRHTLRACLAAVGSVCHAIDLVMQNQLVNAFCVVRPPGHHAEPKRAMGFCFFNNIGIGSFHALDQYHLERVAIIDFDVHHGNGTAKRVAQEERILYVSLHQAPLFPGTGYSHETGKHNNLVNIPLRPKTSSTSYRRAFAQVALPRIEAFGPQLILLSAGFDAHKNDPLADLRLTDKDFYWITAQIMQLAWRCCDGRVVSVLEGGYHLKGIADCAESHLAGLVHGAYPPGE